MTFNLKTFLSDLVTAGPSIFAAIMGLTHEVPNVSKTQLMNDSAHVAFGVTAALAHNDPQVVADAQAASAIIDTVTQTIAARTNQTVS